MENHPTQPLFEIGMNLAIYKIKKIYIAERNRNNYGLYKFN